MAATVAVQKEELPAVARAALPAALAQVPALAARRRAALAARRGPPAREPPNKLQIRYGAAEVQ